MKIRVSNLTSTVFAVPAPFNTVLKPGKSTVFSLSPAQVKELDKDPAFLRLKQQRKLDVSEVVAPVDNAAEEAKAAAEAKEAEEAAKAKEAAEAKEAEEAAKAEEAPVEAEKAAPADKKKKKK